MNPTIGKCIEVKKYMALGRLFYLEKCLPTTNVFIFKP